MSDSAPTPMTALFNSLIASSTTSTSSSSDLSIPPITASTSANVTSSTSTLNPAPTPAPRKQALPRNSACRTCRLRKVKCDAVRPHCTPCVKSAKAHGMKVEEVGCAYDDVGSSSSSSSNAVNGSGSVGSGEGSNGNASTSTAGTGGARKRRRKEDGAGVGVSASSGGGGGEKSGGKGGRVKALEEKIAELERMIREQAAINASKSVTAPAPQPATSTSTFQYNSTSFESQAAAPSTFDPFSTLSSLANSSVRDAASITEQSSFDFTSIMDPPVMGGPASTDNSPNSSDPLLELLWPGWSKTLPNPTIVQVLVDSFFARDHAGKNLVDKAKFCRNLLLPPTHAQFPHLSLIHAICAIGARFVNKDTFSLEFEGVPKYWLSDESPENYHARCAKEFIDEAIAQGRKLFQVAQTIVLVSFYAYSHARYVEVWLYCGLGTRLATPLGLNHLEGVYKGDDPDKMEKKERAGKPSILPPPRDDHETYERACTFWSAFCADRFASASTGWATSIDEADISTLLPVLPGTDMKGFTDANSPLSLSSPDFFTSHPPHLVNSFQLHIKSVVLLGRVVTFMQRAPWPIDTKKGSNFRATTRPGFIAQPRHFAESPLGTPIVDVRNSTTFKKIDADVVKFRLSFPKEYNNILSKTVDGQVDSNLVTAHIIPHVCTIILHEPFCSPTDDMSLTRCLSSAKAILSSIYLLWSSSYEIALLSPFCTWCWAVAGRTLVREIAIKERCGDLTGAASVRQEVDVILAAMTGYGQRAPLGLNTAENLRRLLDNPAAILDDINMPVWPVTNPKLPVMDPVVATFCAEAITSVEEASSNSNNDSTTNLQNMEIDSSSPNALENFLQQVRRSNSNSSYESPATGSSSSMIGNSPSNVNVPQQQGMTPADFSNLLMGFENSVATQGGAVSLPFSDQVDQMKILMDFMEKNGLSGAFNAGSL